MPNTAPTANTSAQVEYSLNGGSTWIPVGSPFTADSATLTLHEMELNQPGPVRVRIVKTSGGSARMNLDDITMNSFGGPPPKSPPILAPIGSTSIIVSNELFFSVTATPTEGDPVTLSTLNLPSGAMFTSTNENGHFTWTPTVSELGAHDVTFVASDVDGSSSEIITIDVIPPIPTPSGTNVLAYYSFDDGSAFTNVPENAAPLIGVSPFTSSDGTWSSFSGNPGNAIADSGWTDSSLYFKFSVTIPSGYQLLVSGFSFEHRRSSAGPTSWDVRASYDNFATALGTGGSLTSVTSNNVALALSPLVGQVEFRVRGSGASTAGGTWRVDNVYLFGELVTLGGADQPPTLFPVGHKEIQAGAPLVFDVVAVDAVDLDNITLFSTNVPFAATFPPLVAAGGVTNTFSATFPWPGQYPVTFEAQDNDGVSRETILITVTGTGSTILQSSFTSGLPAGWTVTTNEDNAAFWRFDDPGDWDNNTGGDGFFATADSDHAGEVWMDTELISPAFSLAGATEASLSFKTHLRIFSGEEFADVDVSANGLSGPWINLWRRQVDISGPTTITLDLEPALGSTNVMIRFYYYDAFFDWYWQVDDVVVTGATVAYTDMDGDGIPDEWEQQFFGNLTTANQFSDYSNNGFRDFDAFRAGSDPINPNSALQFEQTETDAGNAPRIYWQSATGRVYTVSRATNLFGGFSPVISGVSATPPLNTFTDTNAVGPGPFMYRIELE